MLGVQEKGRHPVSSKDFDSETLSDSQRKVLREFFAEDGSQKRFMVARQRSWSYHGSDRPTAEWSACEKLCAAGVMERADFHYTSRRTGTEETQYGFRVKPEFCFLVNEPAPVALSGAMVSVLDYLEANGGGPLTAKDMAYASPYVEKKTGLTAASVTSNCKKLVEVGLLSEGKVGRATAWTRTDMPRPETAEERKARLEEARLERLRKDGLAHICQGCLRVILINETGSFGEKDKVCRHGWQVVGSGERGYGHYGSFHTDGCVGWNHLPLEKGYDIAVSVMKGYCKAVDDAAEVMARLLTKPTFKMARSEWEKWSEREVEENPTKAAELVEVKLGDNFKGRYGSERNSYDKVHASRVQRERNYLMALCTDLNLFHKRVSDFWAEECKEVLAKAKAQAEKADASAKSAAK